jgi:hypothetical protein
VSPGKNKMEGNGVAEFAGGLVHGHQRKALALLLVGCAMFAGSTVVSNKGRGGLAAARSPLAGIGIASQRRQKLLYDDVTVVSASLLLSLTDRMAGAFAVISLSTDGRCAVDPPWDCCFARLSSLPGTLSHLECVFPM